MARVELIRFFQSQTIAKTAWKQIDAAIPGATRDELAAVVRSVVADAARKEQPKRYAHAIFSKPAAVRERLDEVREKADAAKAKADAAAATNDASKKKEAAAKAQAEKIAVCDAFEAALDARLARLFSVGDVVRVASAVDNPYRLTKTTGMGSPTKELRALGKSEEGSSFKIAMPLARLVMFGVPESEQLKGRAGAEALTNERLLELVNKSDAARAAS